MIFPEIHAVFMLVQVELGKTCNDQRSLLIPAGGLGALSVPQRVQGRALVGVQGTKPPEDAGSCSFTATKTARNSTLTVHFPLSSLSQTLKAF